MSRLNVNIDHIATIRQARRTNEPNPVSAAVICELAGADGITTHLRSDRRHIQDYDLIALKQVVITHLNVEMAATDEMVEIATRIKPDVVTLVPERPQEVTTEGGLDVALIRSKYARPVTRNLTSTRETRPSAEPGRSRKNWRASGPPRAWRRRPD